MQKIGGRSHGASAYQDGDEIVFTTDTGSARSADSFSEVLKGVSLTPEEDDRRGLSETSMDVCC